MADCLGHVNRTPHAYSRACSPEYGSDVVARLQQVAREVVAKRMTAAWLHNSGCPDYFVHRLLKNAFVLVMTTIFQILGPWSVWLKTPVLPANLVVG